MKIKQFLCSAAALCLFLLCLNATAFASGEDMQTTTKNEMAYGLLRALNIITGEQEPSELKITRGEFTELAVRMMNYSEPEKKKTVSSRFTDVDEKFAWAVDIAADLGIVCGYDYGLFLPDKNVTADEACKMLVCVLGYDAAVLPDNDRTAEYRRLGYKLGLFDNVSADGADELSWNDCILLIYNALGADILIMETDMKSYVTGETLLKHFFKTEYDEGIVNEAGGASIFKAEGNITGEEALIGDRELIYSGDELKSYLGYNVRYYYSSNDGEESLIYFCPVKNRVKKVLSRDLTDYSDSRYTYFENGRSNGLSLSGGYSIMYNGRLLTSGYDKNYYLPKSGYITAVDNNMDNKYDVVFIWDYINRIVKSVNINDRYISFDYEGNGIKILDLEDENVEVYTYEGEKSDLSAIKAGNSVSVAISGKEGDPDRLYTIYVSKNTVNGILREITEEECRIKTDDGELIFNKERWEENIFRLEEARLGAAETFYISYMGEIFAAAGSNDANMKTAFLISARASDEDEKLYLKVLTTGNEFVTLECEGRFTISGPYAGDNPSKRTKVQVSDASQALTLLTNNNNDNMVNEPVRYKLNNDGKVVLLEIAVPCYGTDDDGNVDVKGDGFHCIVSEFKNLMYSSHSNAFMPALRLKKMEDLVFLDTDRTFFTVPGEYDPMSELKAQYAAKGSLTNDRSQWVKLYATNGNSKAADIIVIAGDAKGSPSDTSAVYGVSNVKQVVNTDDEVVWQIDVINKGTKLSFRTDDESLIDGVSKGDLIRINTDASGAIGSLERVLSYDSENNKIKVVTNTAYSDGSGFVAAEMPAVTDEAGLGKIRKFIFGAGYEIVNGRLLVCLEKELERPKTSVEAVTLKAFSNIQVFDGKNWKTGTAEDVYDYESSGKYSMIFVRLNYANAGELYVYNLNS